MFKFLLVADTESVTAELGSALGPLASEIIEVADGRLVRDAVESYNPDLVVLDMQVSSMGGMAICLDLRLEESGGRLPHVNVLMLTDRRADVFLARRSGAEGYLVKPLDPIRIRKAAKLILGGGRYDDPSYAPTDTTPARL